ncbi:hypothetical protein FRC03_010782 [Tulasnella sp. 419]|nr:hypothetical protein FRC03_010782 [Tulasnella sp. 419]
MEELRGLYDRLDQGTCKFKIVTEEQKAELVKRHSMRNSSDPDGLPLGVFAENPFPDETTTTDPLSSSLQPETVRPRSPEYVPPSPRSFEASTTTFATDAGLAVNGFPAGIRLSEQNISPNSQFWPSASPVAIDPNRSYQDYPVLSTPQFNLQAPSGSIPSAAQTISPVPASSTFDTEKKNRAPRWDKNLSKVRKMEIKREALAMNMEPKDYVIMLSSQSRTSHD